VNFSDAEKKMMTEKIQNAGTVVVEAKAGKGSATLSMVSREGILSAHLVPNIASMMSMSGQRADGRKVWVCEPLQVGRENRWQGVLAMLAGPHVFTCQLTM